MTDYSEIARTFDVVAPAYDDLYGAAANDVMAWLRWESLSVMRSVFPAGGHLLEIGCGTGDDALALARAGYTILATDISSAMIALTRRKAQTAHLADCIDVQTLAAGELTALGGEAGFDGAYSSFGALNCEPDLRAFAAALHDRLRPGAAFVCSVMTPICPVEIAWFIAHLRLRQAFRRLKRGWHPAGIVGPDGARSTVPTRYLSLRTIRRAFSPGFAIEAAISLPLLLPPPYLNDIYITHKRWWNALEPLERALRVRWPFNRMGDHLLIVLKRQ